MKFTIYRKSWRRGGEEGREIGGVAQLGATQLLNKENMFCCLGMCAIQHGVLPEFTLTVTDPFMIRRIPKKTILWSKDGNNSILSESAIDANDDEDITEAERERKLTAIFRKHGHELEFVNRLAPKSWRVAGKE